MKSFFKQKNKYKKGLARRPMAEGFTLVETLVAISIFSMSILAVLVVLSQGINNDNYAKKKILASYLAQEGIEYVRNMRDTFVLYDATSSQDGWDAFNTYLTKPTSLCQNSYGCYFGDLAPTSFTDDAQPMAKIPVIACPGDCRQLTYDAATGKYGYTSLVDSGFVRKIKIVSVSANELKVSSTVSWTQNSGNFSITFSESLYNWIE